MLVCLSKMSSDLYNPGFHGDEVKLRRIEFIRVSHGLVD